MSDDKIMKEIADSLTSKKLKVAVAESCTGGLISYRLTQIPGSSAYFDRGFITYSNESKIELLGVPESIIASYGAVSRKTATYMVKGALSHSRADIALSVTGIAGPGGGSGEKPVGTVFIAVGTKAKINCNKFAFSGTRAEIRENASAEALNMLIEIINNKPCV